MSLLINLVVLVVLSVSCTLLSFLLRGSLLDPRAGLYRTRRWEDGGRWYQRVLRVDAWKDRLPELTDVIPAVYSRKRLPAMTVSALRRHARESCRSEATHTMIVVTSVLFALWNRPPIAASMVLLAFVLNAPFIVVQRATRPRLLRLIARREQHEADLDARQPGAARRVLVISAADTGHGHTSIFESLRAELVAADRLAEVTVVDGFDIGQWWLRWGARFYNPLAVNVPFVWGWLYRASEHSTRLVRAIVSRCIRRGLLRYVDEVRPDVIVSLHAVFVGSVLDVLAREELDIPVVPVIADLDNVTRLWRDDRAACTVCPSGESFARMRSLGVPEDRLVRTGFPVRPPFVAARLDAASSVGTPATVLFVNGSQGSRATARMARAVLAGTDCRVEILAGRNRSRRTHLERALSAYRSQGRAVVHGFTPHVAERMMAADLVVLRASPNVLMEAVTLARPLIVVGALRGQEELNPAYVQRHGLGDVCLGGRGLPAAVRRMLADGGRRAREVRDAQLRFRRPDAAREISRTILDAGTAAPRRAHRAAPAPVRRRAAAFRSRSLDPLDV